MVEDYQKKYEKKVEMINDISEDKSSNEMKRTVGRDLHYLSAYILIMLIKSCRIPIKARAAFNKNNCKEVKPVKQ